MGPGTAPGTVGGTPGGTPGGGGGPKAGVEGSPRPAYSARVLRGGRRRARGVTMKSVSVSFASTEWFPVRYPAPGAFAVQGKPLMVRDSLDSTSPERTEVWFSRSRMV